MRNDELRIEPRISVNKLAEYLVTPNPRRRRAIIAEQIKRAAFIVTRYEYARRAIVHYLSEPARKPASLLRMAGVFRDRAAGLDAEDDGRKSLLASARAVEAFAEFAAQLKVRNVVVVPGPKRGADLALNGVRVVVNPDVTLLESGTERRIGGVKFHFPAATRLSTEALRYAATLLHTLLEEQGDHPRRASCIAVDVRASRFEYAPRATRDRMKNVAAACEEIAERWSAIYNSLREKQITD